VDTTPHHTWNERRFVALAAALSGLALPITGLADHLAGDAPGSDTAVGWSIVHVALGAVFVVFGTWHAVLNRRALFAYLRSGAARRLPGREALAAVALVGGVLAVTVAHAVAGP
jgi:hypothetical protein